MVVIHSNLSLVIICGAPMTAKVKGLTDKRESSSFRLLQYMYFSSFQPHHDKTNKITVHPAKTQISLGIRPV